MTLTAPPAAASLSISDLVVAFGGVRAVDKVSFDVRPGEVLGLLGPNGSGKTTLLNAISGQLRPTEGTVALDGMDLIDWMPEDRARLGLVRSFQDARLFPELTVEDVLMVAEDARAPSGTLSTALQLPHARRRESDKRRAVDESLSAFGLQQFRHHRISQLSTGTRRVVDLAVIAAAKPRLLMLDEPTAGIAQREAEAFGPLLKKLQQVTGATIIIVEHDVPLAAALCDRLVVLEAGKVVSIGPTQQVLRDPAAIEAYLGAPPEALARSGRATVRRAAAVVTAPVQTARKVGVVLAQKSDQALGRAKRYGWGPILVLALVMATAPAEQGSITVGLDDLEKHFGVGDLAFGALPFAMSFVGIFWRFLVGRLADRMKRVRLLAVLILAYAVLMGAQSLAVSFAMLVGFRVLLSFTESIEPPTQSLIGDYYPVEERGRRFAIFDTVTGVVGGLLPLALTGVFLTLIGWRAVFLIWVPFGLLCAFLMRRQPEPERGTHDAEFERELEEMTEGLTQEELPAGETSPHAMVAQLSQDRPDRADAIDTDHVDKPLWEVVKICFRIRSWAIVAVAWTLCQVFLNGFMWFGPTYFKRNFHLSDAKVGPLVAAIGLGALPGVVLGGYIADWLLRRGVVNARVWVLAVSLTLGPLTFVPALLINSMWLAMPFFVLAGFFLSLPTAANDAIMTDVIVPELRGRSAAAKGALQAWANIGPAIVGGISYLAFHHGLSKAVSLKIGLLSMIPLYLLGGLLALFALRYYTGDLAFVVAHARAKRLAGEMPDQQEPDDVV
jgi:ABC-type branched-subunit amino acid transport system ATPase component/MFS family permease